jgi:hypothetical protein
MSGVKRAREAALRERREQKAEKKRAAREARSATPADTGPEQVGGEE